MSYLSNNHKPTYPVKYADTVQKIDDLIKSLIDQVEILKTKKEVRYFINQYDHRFGYGATQIFFEQ